MPNVLERLGVSAPLHPSPAQARQVRRRAYLAPQLLRVEDRCGLYAGEEHDSICDQSCYM
jgi:hypothetical protein